MTTSTLRPVLVCALSLALVSITLGGVVATPGTYHDVDEASPTNETGRTLTGTTNETEGTVEETTNGTGDGFVDDVATEVEGPANDTTGAVDDAVEKTTNGTRETLDGAAETTTETIDDVTNSSTVEDTVDGTTAGLDGTIDETADELDGGLIGGTHAVPATESGPTEANDPKRAVAAERMPTADARTPGPTRAEKSDGERDERRAGAAGDEQPRPGSGVGDTMAGILALVAISSSVSDLAWFAVVGSFPRPRPVRVTLRVLRAGGNLPWKYVVALRSDWRDSESLEHDHRHTLYETITETPGVHLSELGARSDLSLSSVRHHLRVLHRENLIETEKVRGKRRFYPVDADDTRRMAALSDPTVRRLLETLAALGEARNDRLADELDRSPSTVSHHLSSLEEDGLVVRERDGRTTVNRVAQAVETWLEEAAADGDAAASGPRSDD